MSIGFTCSEISEIMGSRRVELLKVNGMRNFSPRFCEFRSKTKMAAVAEVCRQALADCRTIALCKESEIYIFIYVSMILAS